MVYRNVITGKHELLVFNPVDGSVESKPRQMADGFTQAVMIHQVTEDHIK